MEIGLCLELRDLDLLGNPLSDPFPPSISGRGGGGGSGGEGGQNPDSREIPGPSTWIQAYQGSRMALHHDRTKKDIAIKLGTQSLLSAVRDRMDPTLYGQVRHRW